VRHRKPSRADHFPVAASDLRSLRPAIKLIGLRRQNSFGVYDVRQAVTGGLASVTLTNPPQQLYRSFLLVFIARPVGTEASVSTRMTHVGGGHSFGFGLHMDNRVIQKLLCYSAPCRAENPYCDDLSVCLSRREHISGTACPIFTGFTHATYVRGSVLLWRRCDMLCTSGFMDDVMFVHNGQD